tara:strand:- start:1170 stop:1364 length:195 start_codon:yes stop_codon:yes gene_type:complete
MVNPRWRPEIANSRIPNKKSTKEDRKALFSLPKTEPYIGTHIKSDLGGKKVSNKSYEKYYKDLI